MLTADVSKAKWTGHMTSAFPPGARIAWTRATGRAALGWWAALLLPLLARRRSRGC